MSKPDLDAVLARRAAVANELAVIEKMRTEMEAEDLDLVVAERVLKRLQSLTTAEGHAAPSNDASKPAVAREA